RLLRGDFDECFVVPAPEVLFLIAHRDGGVRVVAVEDVGRLRPKLWSRGNGRGGCFWGRSGVRGRRGRAHVLSKDNRRQEEAQDGEVADGRQHGSPARPLPGSGAVRFSTAA